MIKTCRRPDFVSCSVFTVNGKFNGKSKSYGKATRVLCSGLQDQLLGRVVAEERPDLEEAKNQLIVSNARMKQELKEIEDQILLRLSSSEGNPVDDEELIRVLGASKIKAGEIQVCQRTTEEPDQC